MQARAVVLVALLRLLFVCGIVMRRAVPVVCVSVACLVWSGNSECDGASCARRLWMSFGEPNADVSWESTACGTRSCSSSGYSTVIPMVPRVHAPRHVPERARAPRDLRSPRPSREAARAEAGASEKRRKGNLNVRIGYIRPTKSQHAI